MTVQASPHTEQRSRVLGLIAAVAAGDATREDVVAELKNEGIDSLGVLVEALADISRKSERRIPRFFDPTQVAQPGPDRSPSAKHQVPNVPFVLGGVMYDPEDISRFDDRDLHMIAPGPGEPLIAIDDREMMARWWQLDYLTAASNRKYKGVRGGEGGGRGGAVEPRSTGGLGGGVGVYPPVEGLGFPPYPPDPYPHTNFYEHYNYEGCRLELGEGETLLDLTDEATGLFGWGTDWNDRISSVQFVVTHKAVLWEHINQTGGSLTIMESMPSLPGWNDTASSVWTQ